MQFSQLWSSAMAPQRAMPERTSPRVSAWAVSSSAASMPTMPTAIAVLFISAPRKSELSLRHRECGFGSRLDILERHARRRFLERQFSLMAIGIEHAEVRDDHVDALAARQRQAAALDDLGFPLLVRMLHQHDHALDAGDQIHRP